jgi:hypothetical protein
LWTPLAGALLAGLALAACMDDESANPPLDDIDTGWACAPDPTGGVRAVGTVTNHSSTTSFYVIEIAIERGDEVLDEDSATIDEVAPGETARVDARVSDLDGSGASCTVTGVERFKA